MNERIALNWKVVRLHDKPVQPWRNGLGKTIELLSLPDASHWDLRLSVATIDQPAAFSNFADAHRWLAVLEGGSVDLTVDGLTTTVQPKGDVFSFSGSASVFGSPNSGSTQDLNLMLRGREGCLTMLCSGVTLKLPIMPQPTIVCVYAHDLPAEFLINTNESSATKLSPHTLLWIETDQVASLFCQSGCMWVGYASSIKSSPQ